MTENPRYYAWRLVGKVTIGRMATPLAPPHPPPQPLQRSDPPAKGPAQKPRGRRSSRPLLQGLEGPSCRPVLASSGPWTKQNKNKEECSAATVPRACRACTPGRPLSVPAPAAAQPCHFADEKSWSRHIKLLTGCGGAEPGQALVFRFPCSCHDVACPRGALKHEGRWEGVGVSHRQAFCPHPL